MTIGTRRGNREARLPAEPLTNAECGIRNEEG